MSGNKPGREFTVCPISNVAFTQYLNNLSSKIPETACLCCVEYKPHGITSTVVDMSITIGEHLVKRFCCDAFVEAMVRFFPASQKLVCSINVRSSRLVLAPPLAKRSLLK